MAAHVLALVIDVHLPEVRTLKAKRSVVKSVLETARRRYAVASSETDHQDAWQRSQLAFAAVGSSAGQVASVLDEVERYVWSVPELQVLDANREWLEVS